MLAFHRGQHNELPAVYCSHKPRASWAVVNLSGKYSVFSEELDMNVWNVNKDPLHPPLPN